MWIGITDLFKNPVFSQKVQNSLLATPLSLGEVKQALFPHCHWGRHAYSTDSIRLAWVMAEFLARTLDQAMGSHQDFQVCALITSPY